MASGRIGEEETGCGRSLRTMPPPRCSFRLVAHTSVDVTAQVIEGLNLATYSYWLPFPGAKPCQSSLRFRCQFRIAFGGPVGRHVLKIAYQEMVFADHRVGVVLHLGAPRVLDTFRFRGEPSCF